MPYQGGGGIGGPRTRKGRPKAPRPRPAPAPKPDVTLGGDRTPARSGHAKATRPAPPSQGHPTRGRKTVSGGTRKHPKLKTYKSPTPSLRKQRQRRRAQVETTRALRRTRRALDELSKPIKRDTDTHIGPLNIEAELEGRGGIAKAAKFVKKGLTSKSGQVAMRAAGVPNLGSEKLNTNLAKDLVDLPAQTIPGAYAVGASAVEAAQGRPQRGKKLIKQTLEHDPIALAAQGKLKQAGKEITKHPGLFAAEVSGVGSAASRGAGAGVRAAARATGSRTLKRIGSTRRAPKVAPGTAIREPRSYSKGLVGKGAQIAVEKVKTGRARRLRQQAKRTRNPEKKAALRAEANRRDPRVMSEREVAKRTNEREDLAEINRRQAVGKATHEARKVLPKKDHRATVSLLIAQKIVKPTRESLRAYRDQLNRELKTLDGARYRTARRLRDQIDAALKDKQLDFAELEAGAGRYAELVVPRQQALVERGMLSAGRERKAKLVPYAVQQMGAKWNAKTKELLGPDGTVLQAEQIAAHMRANGIDPASVPYLPQAPNARGARNFYSSWAEPKNTGGKVRTGEATRKGTFEAHREVGAENVARMEGLIKGADSYAEWIGENAYRGRNGKVAEHSFNTRDEALQYAADNLADSPYEWTAVPTRPLFGRSDQSKALLERADAEGVAETRGVQEAIHDALTNGNGSGKFVLVPKIAADTQAQHARFLGSKGLKVTRKIGRQFSGTVLATSGFTWPLGNVAEGVVRLAIAKAGAASNKLARATIAEMKKIDPDAARDLENRAGTGHLGSYEMQRVHTVAREFNGTTFEPFAKALGAFFRAPGPKQFGQVWSAYTRFVFGKNGALEHQMRLTALGRHIRNEGYRPNWIKDGPRAMQKAAEQAANGMKGTNEQVVAARFVDRALGKYSRWSPEQRFAIAVFTPFIAWSANAVKFFLDVLPKDHPVLLGLLASSERATEEWRNAHGLGRFVDGAAPGFMQASIVVDGKLIPAGRYTPAGLFADPLGTAGGLVMPAFTGIEMATKGLDWKGDPLYGHDSPHDVTDAEKLKAMASSAMGSFVPFFGMKQRIDGKGVSALNPLKGYAHNQKVSAAFDEAARIEARKAAITAKHPKVDSDHPTPEYAKLHRRWRHLQELIYRESKGQYGHKFKEPYAPGGSSAPSAPSGGGKFDFGGDSGGKFDFGAAPSTTHGVSFDAGGPQGARLRALDEAIGRYRDFAHEDRFRTFHNTGKNFMSPNDYPANPYRRVRA